MGKSIPSPQKLQHLARAAAATSPESRRPTAQLKPASKARPNSPSPIPKAAHQLRSTEAEEDARRRMAAESSEQRRVPLAEVVSECVRRWFQDTLRDAKNGDIAMQVLVGQMYYSGYGVARDAQKAKAWISRASRTRSSVWKVGDKHPGYNASDSDSDDAKEEAK